MTIDTPANPIKIILDTNIVISGIGFCGKTREILHLVLDDKIKAVTSRIILAELEDVIVKKFQKLINQLNPINREIREKFIIVKPRKSLDVVKDEDDNRVLEAGAEGKCSYIITGDRDLLNLKTFRNIKIVTPDIFLSISQLIS